MAKRSSQQVQKTEAERQLEVYKRNDMIQKARFNLTVQEQRMVLYAISKIKPNDTYLDEYTFDIKDFYALCGIENQSYTRLKKMLKDLSDKSWWATIKRDDGSSYESVVRWFTTVKTDNGSGKVILKFHEDMMPYLVQLAQGEEFYTKYQLLYILPMSSQYSPRLYEILKSYQYNNYEWFFDIDELKRLLDCQSYKNFNDFKRFVLEPAVEEINKYTDIRIMYETVTSGRKVTRVVFYFKGKSADKLLEAKKEITQALDGQLTISDLLDDMESSSEKYRFFKEE